MMPPLLLRSAGPVAALALAFTPAAAQAAAATCPDAATVQAARIVEFQTMMMGVSVRCKHVGVAISEHLEAMSTTRRTMLTGANDRVAAFLRSLPAKASPAPALPPTPPVAAAKTKAPLAKAPLTKAPLTKAPLAKAPLAKAATGKIVAKPSATPPAAQASRRTDPFDRYLTMIGNQYGAGMTTLKRCKAFDAIVTSLSDKSYTDRLMTMISSSLVQVTLLEAIVNCPPGKE